MTALGTLWVSAVTVAALGSWLLFDASLGFLGGHGIVGGHIPLTTGMGFATKYRNQDQVSVCFFGEAAINNGAFHEALNMAGIWKLPCIFICENNRYAMGTPIMREIALYADVAETARSYGIDADKVDGMDVLAVRTLMREVVRKVRASPQPHFIEAKTYRFMGHSMADPAHGHYRTKEEVDEERKRDPLLQLRQTLLNAGLATDADFEKTERDVGQEVDRAVRFADESPFPQEGELHEDVYAD